LGIKVGAKDKPDSKSSRCFIAHITCHLQFCGRLFPNISEFCGECAEIGARKEGHVFMEAGGEN